MIRDFSRSQGDKIDLSALGELDFIGRDGFHGDAGELRYQTGGNSTYVFADVDGDGDADFGLRLDRLISLNEADFTL